MARTNLVNVRVPFPSSSTYREGKTQQLRCLRCILANGDSQSNNPSGLRGNDAEWHTTTLRISGGPSEASVRRCREVGKVTNSQKVSSTKGARMHRHSSDAKNARDEKQRSTAAERINKRCKRQCRRLAMPTRSHHDTALQAVDDRGRRENGARGFSRLAMPGTVHQKAALQCCCGSQRRKEQGDCEVVLRCRIIASHEETKTLQAGMRAACGAKVCAPKHCTCEQRTNVKTSKG